MCGELFGSGGVVEGEGCNAKGDGEDDGVFVEWVAFAEESYMKKHHWKKFAGLGEDECEVVDMGERGIAEWGGQGRGYTDE